MCGWAHLLDAGQMNRKPNPHTHKDFAFTLLMHLGYMLGIERSLTVLVDLIDVMFFFTGPVAKMFG